MRVLISLCLALFVSSIFLLSCSNSHMIACPDYTKDPRFKTSAQAYKPTKYKPLKVDNNYKLNRVRNSSNQTSSSKLHDGNSDVIEAQTIQIPAMADVLQSPEQPDIKSQSIDGAISPDIGIYLRDEPVSYSGENSGIDKMKLTAANNNEKTSDGYRQSKISIVEQPETEEVDDATLAPPVVVKSRKEKREALRDFRKAAKDYISPQSDGEVKNVTGFAVAALVLGIVSLFFFPFIAGPLAIIFGGMALKRANANPNQEGRGLAVAGLICGIVGTLGGLVVLLLM